MADQHLQRGTMLHNGTYRILDVLGRGGFGITYLALDVSLDRKVAIKEFFPKDYCNRTDTTRVTVGTSSAMALVGQLKAKFLKEARNIAKLSHPGIIKIHAAFEENETAYYVMEYIDGLSLHELVRRDGPMSPDRAVGLVSQVGEALAYVHDRRINHLDIKPGNIMYDASTGRAVLIDFGLSKQYDSDGNQTSSTPPGISTGYAPIEQYKDGGVREFAPQTDIYALGATLYNLVSGVRPPEATELVTAGLAFPPGFPAMLKAPVSHAMSLRPADRPATVKAFVGELKSDEPVLIDLDEPTVTSGVSDKTRISPSPRVASPNRRRLDMPSKPAVSKAKKIFWAGLTAVAGALLIILARDCAELYQNYYYTDDQLWFIAVAGLILVSLPFFVIKKRSRPSTKWWIVTILSLLFILNTLMVMVWWDGSPFSDYTVYDVDGEYVESGINKYVIGGYGVQCWLSTFLLFGIVVLIFSATGSGVNTLTHRYIAVANRYVDALDSGKNYEIEAAEKALRTYFRSQKSRLSNSKFKYQYLKYLDEQGIPFADSVDSLKESLNYAAIARSMA